MPSAKVMQTRIICTKELCRSSPTKNSCCFFHPADSSTRAKNCFSNFSMLNLCPDSSTTQQKLQLHYEVAHQQSFSRPKLPALHSTGWTAEISHRISCLITSRESMLLQRFFESRYFSLNYAMSKCVELWNVFFIASLVAVKVDDRLSTALNSSASLYPSNEANFCWQTFKFDLHVGTVKFPLDCGFLFVA